MATKQYKILIVSDAWYPQVNGVVRTLTYTRNILSSRGHEVTMITPDLFRSFPCPTYPEIRLALFPSARVAEIIRETAPDILHIATEGPLGMAARNYAVRHDLNFSTAYHTRFPEYVHSRTLIPISLTYMFIRWFHKHSKAVMAPTPTVMQDLQTWKIGNPVYWPRGVELDLFTPDDKRKPNKKPIYLSVGRVSVEKNLEAFLSLDLDGEKWVVGDGPAMKKLKAKYPDVNFIGAKNKEELPYYYNLADVFVFPSKTDTFGLVLLEAMACGLPVAAFPVTGPIDVVGIPETSQAPQGGVLDHDLKVACEAALTLPRDKVRAYAETFSWDAATSLFESHLVASRGDTTYNIIDNPHKGNKGVSRAMQAAKNSIAGLVFAINEESAFRQELILALILVPVAVYLPVTYMEKTVMIASVVLVLIVELLNSSVEAAIDRISFDHHGLSKRAKDYGSAAVFLALALCGGIYAVVLASYLWPV